MDKFIIGMYGRFDNNKYIRDFRPGFFGVEACMFPSDQEVEELIHKAGKEGFSFGVHYPLIKKNTPYRDPFFIALDIEEKMQAFEYFENEAAYVSGKGAAYILTHFPKPVLVNRSLDLNYWRFAGNKEWMYSDTYPLELLKENLGVMFEKLSEISSKYNIPVILENDAISNELARSSLLVDLFKKYNKIKICLDIGRLHLQEKLDSSFNAMEFVETMAPYTYLIHLWNTNPVQNLAGGHYPVLPGQKPSEGWANIEGFIEIIIRYNKNVKVLFEHRSDLVNDDELNQCYRWIEQLLGG